MLFNLNLIMQNTFLSPFNNKILFVFTKQSTALSLSPENINFL